LSAKLTASIREELRGFVLERMENDAFHAANAYSWFGVIDRSLISKHGIAVYYNVPIVGIQGVNGLSTLVLCASADYHRHYHKTMSRRNAVDCLAALASVEVFSEPIPRILLNKELNNVPPFPLWEKMIRGLLPNGLAMIGATFSMLISVEMNDETGETGEPVESGRGEVGPKEILEWVLARNEVKRLKDFSQIQQSMSRPRFLS